MTSSKYARVWRAGALALCPVAYVLLLTMPVDSTLTLSILTRRVILGGGIIAATLAAWAVQYTFHVPVTRRVLFPWGAAGGASAVLLAAAQTNSLGDHRAFVLATIARAVLLCLTVRWTIDLVFGPVGGPITWGETTEEVTIPREAAPDEFSSIPTEALRPAWMKDIDRTAANEHAELKLVSEDDARERDAAARARHKRTSG